MMTCTALIETHMKPLNKFLGLKEALEMPHLPEANGNQDECLDNGPPEDSLVGAFAGLSEAFLTVLKDKRTP